MGYWAKDHSYVYDEDDIKIREANIRMQGKSDGFFISDKKEEQKNKFTFETEAEKEARIREWHMSQLQAQAKQRSDQRELVINYYVERERKNWENKGFFGKLKAKVSGKKFDV